MQSKDTQEEKDLKTVILELIKNHPNDFELGKFVRNYYKQNERVFKVLPKQTT